MACSVCRLAAMTDSAARLMPLHEQANSTTVSEVHMPPGRPAAPAGPHRCGRQRQPTPAPALAWPAWRARQSSQSRPAWTRMPRRGPPANAAPRLPWVALPACPAQGKFAQFTGVIMPGTAVMWPGSTREHIHTDMHLPVMADWVGVVANRSDAEPAHRPYTLSVCDRAHPA